MRGPVPLSEASGLCGFPRQIPDPVRPQAAGRRAGGLLRLLQPLVWVPCPPLALWLGELSVREALGPESEVAGARAPGSVWSPHVLRPADREFIEARRRALKRFINLVARHPPFSEDVVLKLFLSFSGPVSTCRTAVCVLGPEAPRVLLSFFFFFGRAARLVGS